MHDIADERDLRRLTIQTDEGWTRRKTGPYRLMESDYWEEQEHGEQGMD